MDIDKTIQNLSQKVAEIESAYTKLNEMLFSIEANLNKSLEEESVLNAKLKELIAKKSAVGSGNGKHPETSVMPDAVSQDHKVEVQDPTAQMEKLLQGTLDVLGDKISDRLMAMLKDLKSIPVEMRATRIHEVKQAADAELIDLSGLYKHENVQSNIEDVGVTETEAKGIDKNLEKLRQLRQSRLKQ
jgi:hypothetical protein